MSVKKMGRMKEMIKPSMYEKKSEHSIQAAFFMNLALNQDKCPLLASNLIFAVPNGGLRNKRTAAGMKAEGVKEGVADVLVLIGSKGHTCLCLEFKTQTGKQSKKQKEFQALIENQNGLYKVVRCLREATDALADYLLLELNIY